jgi:BirA family transcriptional regulator, biotin operon repressor / biotin---[acetyl-CoA-carboxylase] ligase
MWSNEQIKNKLNNIISDLKSIKNVLIYEEVTSTNDVAHNLEKEDAPSGTVIIANKQTKGRGRLNRYWLMMEGDVALSLILRPPYLPNNEGLLPMMPALAMTKALSKFSLEAKIKWPNDIVVAGPKSHSYLGNFQKLGGILIENVFCQSHLKASIIGLGLNVVNNPSLYEQIPHAAFIKQFCPTVNRMDIVANFLICLDEKIDQIKHDEQGIIKEYVAMCATLGHRVKVNTSLGVIVGEALSIKSDGSLIIFDGTKNHIITAGEVVGI